MVWLDGGSSPPISTTNPLRDTSEWVFLFGRGEMYPHCRLNENPGCFQLRPANQAYLWPSLAQSRRSEPFGVARAACFVQLAGVFASCGALHYAKILASLKIKNGISLTPLNCALNAFTFALNDSADALVERLSK